MYKRVQFLILSFFLFSNVFTQGKGNGFGFTFDGGNPIMNLLSSISSSNSTIQLTPTLYFIQNLSFGKVEPSISYYSTTYTDTDWDGSTSTETNSTIVLGIGFLEDKLKYDNYNTYWGGRISVTSNSDLDVFLIAPVYGAEYNFSNNFSIGGETRINYAFDNSDSEMSVIDISAHLFFRFYK